MESPSLQSTSEKDRYSKSKKSTGKSMQFQQPTHKWKYTSQSTRSTASQSTYKTTHLLSIIHSTKTKLPMTFTKQPSSPYCQVWWKEESLHASPMVKQDLVRLSLWMGFKNWLLKNFSISQRKITILWCRFSKFTVADVLIYWTRRLFWIFCKINQALFRFPG